MNLHDKVFKFLSNTKLATIATSDPESCRPESALIAFTGDSNLNIYFQTGDKTRKFKNLMVNPKVAFVIGFSDITIQYEGIASQIDNKDAITEIKKLFRAKNSPTTEKFLNRPGVAFFKVAPTWVAYSDYSSKPPFVEEITQF